MRVFARCIVTLTSVVGFALPAATLAESDADAAARLRAEIGELIVQANKCRNVVNCRVVGLGARPCGGPEEYLSFSIWNNTGDSLGTLISEYNLLREELILDSDEFGTCEALPKPNADCVRGRCVIVPAEN